MSGIAPPPTMFVLIGLPASGKTTRARQLASEKDAIRITPDDWMFPLFGDPQPEGKRDILEGRLVWISLCILKRGVNAVLDFGVWSLDERSALRYLAGSVGALCELVYLEVDAEENVRRLNERPKGTGVATFEISTEDLSKYRDIFQIPTSEELMRETLDDPPTGFDNWGSWAQDRWPSLTSEYC